MLYINLRSDKSLVFYHHFNSLTTICNLSVKKQRSYNYCFFYKAIICTSLHKKNHDFFCILNKDQVCCLWPAEGEKKKREGSDRFLFSGE